MKLSAFFQEMTGNRSMNTQDISASFSVRPIGEKSDPLIN